MLNDVLTDAGLKLPLFVTALISGIVISNLMPGNFPRLPGRR
jgi:ESS family glutamate:Na+ symporter